MQDLTTIGQEIHQPVTARARNTRADGARIVAYWRWSARRHVERFLARTARRHEVGQRPDRALAGRSGAKKHRSVAPDATARDDFPRLGVGQPDGTEIDPPHRSFGLLHQLPKTPAGGLRSLPMQIVSDVRQSGTCRTHEGEEVKTRRVDDKLFAATGPNYGPISGAEVVEAVPLTAGNSTGDERSTVFRVEDVSISISDPDAPVTQNTATLCAGTG